jgi:hypothetical protein
LVLIAGKEINYLFPESPKSRMDITEDILSTRQRSSHETLVNHKIGDRSVEHKGIEHVDSWFPERGVRNVLHGD